MYLSETQPHNSMQLIINTTYWAQPAQYLNIGVFSNEELQEPVKVNISEKTIQQVVNPMGAVSKIRYR